MEEPGFFYVQSPTGDMPLAFSVMFSCERLVHLLYLYSFCKKGGVLALFTQEGSFLYKLSGELHLVPKSPLLDTSIFLAQLFFHSKYRSWCGLFLIALLCLYVEPQREFC